MAFTKRLQTQLHRQTSVKQDKFNDLQENERLIKEVKVGQKLMNYVKFSIEETLPISEFRRTRIGFGCEYRTGENVLREFNFATKRFNERIE